MCDNFDAAFIIAQQFTVLQRLDIISQYNPLLLGNQNLL